MISMKTERTLRVFQADSYVSADLHGRTMTRYSKRGDGPVSGPDDVAIDRQSFGESDALMDQAKAFLESVAGGPAPLVSGRVAMEALETAMVIGDLGPTPLKVPVVLFSTRRMFHSPRSRQSMNWTGSSGFPGAITSPPL